MCHWCEVRLACRIVMRWHEMYAVCNSCTGDIARPLDREEVARELAAGEGIRYDVDEYYAE